MRQRPAPTIVSECMRVHDVCIIHSQLFGVHLVLYLDHYQENKLVNEGVGIMRFFDIYPLRMINIFSLICNKKLCFTLYLNQTKYNVQPLS